MQIAKAADHVLSPAQFKHATADLISACLYTVNDGGEWNAVSQQFIRVELYLVFLDIAADARHFRHSGDRLERIAKVPILQSPQVGQTQVVTFVYDCVFIDPSSSSRIRA